jgi:hypothetical protein
MFSKCGDGIFIMRMDDKDRFRICRVDGRVNWVKCKEILSSRFLFCLFSKNWLKLLRKINSKSIHPEDLRFLKY